MYTYLQQMAEVVLGRVKTESKTVLFRENHNKAEIYPGSFFTIFVVIKCD